MATSLLVRTVSSSDSNFFLHSSIAAARSALPMPRPLKPLRTHTPRDPLWSLGVLGATLRTSHHPTTWPSTSATTITRLPSLMACRVAANHFCSSCTLGRSRYRLSPKDGSASASGKNEDQVSTISSKSFGLAFRIRGVGFDDTRAISTRSTIEQLCGTRNAHQSHQDRQTSLESGSRLSQPAKATVPQEDLRKPSR